MAINKIIYGNQVLLDLTGDTTTPDKVLLGFTYHDAAGEQQQGTCTFDLDTSDATLKVAEALEGKTFGARGAMMTGTMKNNGAVSGVISTKGGTYTVPIGYHDGSGTVVIDPAEMAKLIASNIRQGVTILGVEGTMSGSEGVKAQSKTVTPSTSQQTILPDSGYTHLSQVVVAKIPYVESPNAAGGNTVTIG
jgi:hypothetical protein